MQGSTHIFAGSAAGLCLSISEGLNITQTGIVTSIVVVASLIPDIDCHTSKIGHSCGGISKLIQFIFGHRTMFHSPIFYFILAMVLKNYGVSAFVLKAGLLGITSHLLLDMLNPMGIPVLYPIPYNYRLLFGIVNSGGLIDHILGATFALITLILSVPLVERAFSNLL